MSVSGIPAILGDREGNRYARLALLRIGDQDHEVFEVPCWALTWPGCVDMGEHHHWVPLAPVAISGRS